MRKITTISALWLTLIAPLVEAAPFSFSYTDMTGDVIAGVMNGSLQEDNNTVLVTSVADFVTVNGINGPSLPFVSTESNGFGSRVSGVPGIVSLNGSIMNFAACPTPSNGQEFCDEDGFAFSTTPFLSPGLLSPEGGPEFVSGPSFGGPTIEFYNPANWHLSPLTVQEPGSFSLLALGALALTLAGRRRSMGRVHARFCDRG